MRRKPRRLRMRVRIAVPAAVLAAPAFVVSPPATAPAKASFGINVHMGWDACGATVAKAQAFWSNTPYWNMGLYLGGSAYATGCKRWTTAEVNRLRAQGWQFLPLWVGPQAPCTGFSSRFSSTRSTATSQGRNEAIAAYNKIVSLGWNTAGTPIIYDLEAFNTGNSRCLNAAKAFINGWDAQMHVAPAQKAGVYGSSCASGLSSYASIANVPDFITGADWDNIKTTTNLACVASNSWSHQQRHKQYRGGHNETWNGVTMNVDSDCSNGPVYPGPNATNNTQGCV